MKKSNLRKDHRKIFLLMAMVAGTSGLPSQAWVGPGLQVVQQAVTVKGQVVDNQGEPVIGATIKVKGIQQGTVTDLNGNYSISGVPAQGILVVSYVGYKEQEIAYSGGRPVNIKLIEDDKMLNEVVVVGYGVQKKSDITGSVTSVNKDRLQNLPVTNVLQAVQGAAAGITIQQSSALPGASPTATVRGRNSINADSGPYVVVDGVPISKSGGSLNDISPNDIESIEILKDATATAIYGVNGANGVILVTTKHGKDGKPSISYNGYMGIEDFTHRLKFCNGAEITQRYKDYVAQNPGESMYNEYVKNQYEADNQAEGKETDWIDEATQIGILQNHSVSINGGAERVKYFVSGGFMDQKGLLKGFNYKRFSLRTNLDVDVTDYMRVGTNSYIVAHNRDGGRVNFVMAEAMSPYAKEYNDDGTYCIYPMYSETLFFNPMISTT